MNLSDTILAVSSPGAGEGGGVRGIIRLSGPAAWELARGVTTLGESAAVGWHGDIELQVGEVGIAVAILLFRGPRSFTGQDVAELHLPNSPALMWFVMDALMSAAGRLNRRARLAEPGEFTARAFFNGKVDLTEAEGIAATINAVNETQLRAAAGLREGDLHRQMASCANELAQALALVEAGIDFTDEEDVHLIAPAQLESMLVQQASGIHECLATGIRIDRLAAPPTVVFIGLPNVGKSSLINALSGRERSIVSPIAGTTRDLLSVIMPTPAGEVCLMDVPGEEEAVDALRQKMMAARRRALLDADLVVEVMDSSLATRLPSESVDSGARCLTVRNKADLLPEAALAEMGNGADGAGAAAPMPWRLVSAKTGLNIELLKETVAAMVNRDEAAGGGGRHRVTLNLRHRLILQEVKESLYAAASLAREERAAERPELLAAELRRALDLLGQITGAISPDDVLGRIFADFCIGK